MFMIVLTSPNNAAFSDDPIRILYNERPPYLITVSQGIVKGLTAAPVNQAFQKAGVAHFWQLSPSKRQIHTLKSNKGRDCLAGWFKKPEREKFAKYTKLIYQDLPTIGLALISNTKIESGKNLKDVLQDKNIILLTKSGYSYGKFIDDLINDVNPVRFDVNTENTNMVKMLHKKRADYIFMAEEEAEGLINSAHLDRKEFKLIRFLDMPSGNKRYILCSKEVNDQEIEKLNRWISAPTS